MTEFQLIQDYFARKTPHADLGIGDDAAAFSLPDNHICVTCVDTIIEDVHFFKGTPADAVGYKALAVNLSDLAAMGAKPLNFLLALTLPAELARDDSWLNAFSAGLFRCANAFNIELIGGDTTCGPLSISITANGVANKKQLLRRNGAQVGDLIYVSGSIGDAARALAQCYADEQPDKKDLKRLLYPTPRIALGLALRDIATSCIDVSDGLLADLNHILQASQVGAQLTQTFVHSGDDYELCFTVAPNKKEQILDISHLLDLPLTPIGTITDTQRLEAYDSEGNLVTMDGTGYQHFE